MPHNFVSSNRQEYFWQKPHYNWANQIIHSDLYKKLNPIRQPYDYHPQQEVQVPWFMGSIPVGDWTYNSLDYSFHKYHRHYQTHDEWYPDRKNKTLGRNNGSGTAGKMQMDYIYMGLQPVNIPRGCFREIRTYQACKEKTSPEACFQEKVNIMEVCPDHVLEGLREKKKHLLRAEAIDNEAYKRAMTISDYNKGRSVSDLQLKTWDYGAKLRTDSWYADDRWNPTKYSHPHRYDNVNFPEQEYRDFFGGTVGEAEQAEQERYRLDFSGSTSQAIQDFQSARRISKIKEAVHQVEELNKHDSKGHH